MTFLPSFDKIDEAFLKNLEADPVNFESFHIEYKVDYDNNPNELRRDVISFANGIHEGYIFYGIQDSPIKIIGIDKSKVDAIKIVLNNVLPSKIEPIISPFPSMKPIPLSNGKYVVVIKIIPKENGIYGIRQGENQSSTNYLLYEFWVRMDGSKRRLKIEDIQNIILEKNGVEKKKLDVNIETGSLLIPLVEDILISIKAVNKSTRPIVITNYGIDFIDKNEKMTIMSNNFSNPDPIKQFCDPLPKKIGDGENCSAYVGRVEVEKKLKEKGYIFPVEIRAFFRTNDGIFYSNVVDLEEWK